MYYIDIVYIGLDLYLKCSYLLVISFKLQMYVMLFKIFFFILFFILLCFILRTFFTPQAASLGTSYQRDSGLAHDNTIIITS